MQRKMKDWENIDLLHVNRKDSRADFSGYNSMESALTYDEVKSFGKITLDGLWKNALYGCILPISYQSTICAYRKSYRDL